jgi:phage terminase large subunit-like protein
MTEQIKRRRGNPNWLPGVSGNPKGRKPNPKPVLLAWEPPTTDLIAWAEANWCPPSCGGQPIHFEDHQRRILSHLFTKDSHGRYPYQTILWSEPKKSGKTELAGLVSYWLAVDEPYGEVYLLCNDFEQAKSRGFQALTRAVINFRPPLKPTLDKLILPTGATIQAIASEYAGAAGANPSASVWDELWAYTSEQSRRLWEEFTPVPTRLNSLRVVVTYAGYTGESLLLEELYAKGMAGQPVPGLEDIDDGDGGPACRAADGLFMFWSHRPRMPWQTPKYYREQKGAPGFRPNAYLRLHENRWVAAESRFIDMTAYDACVDRKLRPLMPCKDRRLYVGVDAATKRDTCAAVAVFYDGQEKKVVLAQHRIWKPGKGAPIDLEDTVEAWLLDLHDRYRIDCVGYDPYQMERSAATMRKAGVPIEPFLQTAEPLTKAGQNLFDLINGGNITFYNAPDLREQVQNAVAVESTRGWRIAKDKASRKVDAAVALAMAALLAVEQGSSGGSARVRFVEW